MQVQLRSVMQEGTCLIASYGETIKKALEAVNAHGTYTLTGLRNGYASVPKDVRTLTVGAACCKGVALYFPFAQDVKGCRLDPAEYHGRLDIDPRELRAKLIEGLEQVDDESGTENADSKNESGAPETALSADALAPQVAIKPTEASLSDRVQMLEHEERTLAQQAEEVGGKLALVRAKLAEIRRLVG